MTLQVIATTTRFTAMPTNRASKIDQELDEEMLREATRIRSESPHSSNGTFNDLAGFDEDGDDLLDLIDESAISTSRPSADDLPTGEQSAVNLRLDVTTNDLAQRLIDARVSYDQVETFIWWKASGEMWSDAAKRAKIETDIAWDLECDPDIRETVLEKRTEMQETPERFFAEMMPAGIAQLRDRVESGAITAVEALLKFNLDYTRKSGNRAKGSSIEARRAGTTVSERSRINGAASSFIEGRFRKSSGKGGSGSDSI